MAFKMKGMQFGEGTGSSSPNKKRDWPPGIKQLAQMYKKYMGSDEEEKAGDPVNYTEYKNLGEVLGMEGLDHIGTPYWDPENPESEGKGSSDTRGVMDELTRQFEKKYPHKRESSRSKQGR